MSFCSRSGVERATARLLYYDNIFLHSKTNHLLLTSILLLISTFYSYLNSLFCEKDIQEDLNCFIKCYSCMYNIEGSSNNIVESDLLIPSFRFVV